MDQHGRLRRLPELRLCPEPQASHPGAVARQDAAVVRLDRLVWATLVVRQRLAYARRVGWKVFLFYTLAWTLGDILVAIPAVWAWLHR